MSDSQQIFLDMLKQTEFNLESCDYLHKQWKELSAKEKTVLTQVNHLLLKLHKELENF